MRKSKIQKYRYYENKNKMRKALTNENKEFSGNIVDTFKKFNTINEMFQPHRGYCHWEEDTCTQVVKVVLQLLSVSEPQW